MDDWYDSFGLENDFLDVFLIMIFFDYFFSDDFNFIRLIAFDYCFWARNPNDLSFNYWFFYSDLLHN